MKVITICSRKGGTFKSGTARSLAVAALFDGKRSAIIDSDPQGSVLVWAERREAPAPAVVPVGTNLKATIASLRDADFVFIDTPPSTHAIINTAIGLSDLAVIVTGPFPEDLAAIGATVQAVRAAQKPGVMVLTRTPPRASAVDLARSALQVFEMPICPTAIVQRVAHPYAASRGQTAQEWEGEGGAAREIEQVWKFVKGQLSGKA